MIIELVDISVSPAKRQELGKALVWLKGALQVQPGCLRCRVFQIWPAQDFADFWQIEARWDGQQNLIRHIQSDTFKRLLQLMELSAAPPVLEFLAVAELRGLDLVEAARISPC
jgi:quinol monooxygenase YgiN